MILSEGQNWYKTKQSRSDYYKTKFEKNLSISVQMPANVPEKLQVIIDQSFPHQVVCLLDV